MREIFYNLEKIFGFNKEKEKKYSRMQINNYLMFKFYSH